MKLVTKMAKQGESLYKEETLTVRFESEGLTTTIHTNCTTRSGAQKIFSFLDFPYMSFKAFKRCETFVGEKALEIVSKKVIENALQEEIKLTIEVNETDKYKKLPALTVSLDMGWQKRSSGRRYDSPSGIIHCIGARSGKIIYSFVS